MTDWVEVGKTSDLSEGSLKEVVVEKHSVLLARVGDEYFAADNKCPHLGAKLSEGKLEGKTLICPRHHSQFDMEDGHVIKWAKMPPVVSTLAKIVKGPHPLKMYPVKVEGKAILVEI